MTKKQKYRRLRQFKERLIEAATSGYRNAAGYESLRTDWLRHPTLKENIPHFVKDNRTLSEFRFSMKDFGYAGRRTFIRKAFRPMFAALMTRKSNVKPQAINGKLKDFSLREINEAWEEALSRCSSAPTEAVKSAKTMLRYVCHHILEELGESADTNIDLSDLFMRASSCLRLSLNKNSEQGFRQILGASLLLIDDLNRGTNVIDIHPKNKLLNLPKRHAELAVNTAGSISIFLLATLKDKQQKIRSIRNRQEKSRKLATATKSTFNTTRLHVSTSPVFKSDKATAKAEQSTMGSQQRKWK